MNPLFYVALGAPLIPMAIGLIRLKGLSTGQRCMLAYCAFCIANQSIGLLLSENGASNYPLYHLHVLVEFSTIAVIYFQAKVARINQAARWMVILAFIILGIANGIWGDGIMETPSNMLVLESLLLIIFVVAYFLKVYREGKILKIEQEFHFWLSLGVLVFFAGTLLISFSMRIILAREDQLFLDIFLIRAVLIILTNICYTIGMLCKAHPQKS